MSGFPGGNRSFLFSQVLIHPWLATNPLFRDRLVGAVRILRKTGNKPANTSQTTPLRPRPFGILAIAVDPNRQRLGVGRLLMRDADAIARQRGFAEMILTVSTSNNDAVRFYESMRWVKVVADDVWRGGMRKLLHVRGSESIPSI